MTAELIKMAEIKHIISDFSKNKSKVQEVFLTLQQEKQDLEQMHNILEDALFQSNRRISKKSAHFANQLQQTLSESENRINRTGKKVSELIEKKNNHLETLIRNSKKMLLRIHEEMKTFETDVNRNVNQKMDQVMEKQTIFQQAVMDHIGQTVTGTIGKETNKILNSIENSTIIKIDEFLSRQDTLVEKMSRQFSFFEKQLTVLKNEIDEVRKDQRNQEDKITNYLKKISTKQTAQQQAIKQFGYKLKSLDTELNEKLNPIQNPPKTKRGFFFFKKKIKDPPKVE